MTRPLIGVSTSELRPAEGAHLALDGEPPRRMLALGLAYLDALVAAGGIPVILTPLPPRRLDAMVARLDGICLSGGPDLEPAAYGAARHPMLGPTEPEVDLFELGLARAARRRGLPMLAVCRGLQVLNVSRGGTLVQHLPDLGGALSHRQEPPASRPTHVVTLASGSHLAAVIGRDTIHVNSFHHQAIDTVGRDLAPVGFADDGVIEAVEGPADAFTIGVQWHAECLLDIPEHASLFESLVDAAEDHARFARQHAA